MDKKDREAVGTHGGLDEPANSDWVSYISATAAPPPPILPPERP